jgi:hypothetical protein
LLIGLNRNLSIGIEVAELDVSRASACREEDIAGTIDLRDEMIRTRGLPITLLFNGLFPNVGRSQGHAVAVSAGPDGAAQIALANGKKITIRKERGQTGISEAHIAPDGTVGWLVEYNVDGVSYPVSGTLIVWRAGKTIRRFPAGQSFNSWAFYAQGKQVAFHSGPLHGELKSHCELHDAESGRMMAVCC